MYVKKKNKKITAGILSLIMAFSAALSTAVFAEGPEEANLTYADMFRSLYDDVITNGETNGYLTSPKNGRKFGLPYHSLEELCVGDVDYGHETTSKDAAYLVQLAAMHDVFVKQGMTEGSPIDLKQSWWAHEYMIPGWAENVYGSEKIKNEFWKFDKTVADILREGDEPDQYPTDDPGANTNNPLYETLKSAYCSDNGYYMMHSLVDTDDWYGFGNGSSAYINLFQRDPGESCYETVPAPCFEELKYGNDKYGIRGIVIGEKVEPQYVFKNDPSADYRAVQTVYFANRWNVFDSSLSALAGKSGDQLRNVMFDKFYKEISENTSLSESGTNKEKSQHYLISGETQWGGQLGDMNWISQTSGSAIHQADQNPLAAYALLTDSSINSGMKAGAASDDYRESLKRQIELYLWLQSCDGPFAGGCTNSLNGRYESYSSGGPTFYKMTYVEQPNHTDQGSNADISSQVQSVQRLAELYYYIKTNGDNTDVRPGGLSMEEALDAVLGRWFEWAEANTHFDWEAPDGTYYTYCIPKTLTWMGKPGSWSYVYDPYANNGLRAIIKDYGQDVGSVSALCNALIYYAAAKGVDPYAAISDYNTSTETKGLHLANQLLERQWSLGRDDVGISIKEHNEELARVFEEEVYIPDFYSGKMPDGSLLEQGATFSSIRKKYESVPAWQEACRYYRGYGTDNNNDGVVNISDYEYNMHRFQDECDAVMAYGTMALLYPDVVTVPKQYRVDFVTEPYCANPEPWLPMGGETVTAPLLPNDCGGKHIAGWYKDSVDDLFDFNTPITGDTTLHAVWEDINNSVISQDGKTFFTYYGDAIELTCGEQLNGSVSCEVTLNGNAIPCTQSRTAFIIPAKAIPAGETASVKYTVTGESKTVCNYSVSPVYKSGDLNGSGGVDSTDAALYLKQINGIEEYQFDEELYKRADTNCDLIYDILDVVMILNKADGQNKN